MTAIRVPARVVAYMDGTGWATGGDAAEVAADPVRQRLIAAIAGRRNADGSVTIRNPSPAMLARLYVEGDHCAESLRGGDANPDTLADYNAGTAMMRRAAARLPEPTDGIRARELMYSERVPMR